MNLSALALFLVKRWHLLKNLNFVFKVGAEAALTELFLKLLLLSFICSSLTDLVPLKPKIPGYVSPRL